MKRYQTKEAFNAKTFNNKLMALGQYLVAETPEQEAELDSFARQGSCTEIVSTPAPKAEKIEKKVEVNPVQDLAGLSGIGAKLYHKLTEAGFNTVDELKAALLDPSREEEMKKLLGISYEKVLANFKQ